MTIECVLRNYNAAGNQTTMRDAMCTRIFQKFHCMRLSNDSSYKYKDASLAFGSLNIRSDFLHSLVSVCRKFLMKLLSLLLAAIWRVSLQIPDHEGGVSQCDSQAGSVHDFIVETLDGRNESMSKYKGHVIVIVNVATY